MRVSVSVTDEKGNVFEGVAMLTLRSAAKAKAKPARVRLAGTVDFSLSLSHFMKTHGKGLSGPRKFALLVAHLVEGDCGGKSVDFEKIEGAWSRTKRILGPFNPAYSTRAKDNGWVDSPKQGQYLLGKGWDAALAN